MIPSFRMSALCCGLLALAAFAGCNQHGVGEDSAVQSAEEAVGISGNKGGTERTVTEKHDMIVQETTRVIDKDTGEVVKTEETITPVTIEKEKTIETDVNVDAGKSTTTVK